MTESRGTFGPERRILRRSDFVSCQSRGERATTSHFVLLVTATVSPAARRLSEPCREGRKAGRGAEAGGLKNGPGSGCARLGLVVTKKVGNAVQRNRIKRLCRACFRMWPDLVPEGIDLVVIARQGAHELSLANVRAEWMRARPALLKRCAAAMAGVFS